MALTAKQKTFCEEYVTNGYNSMKAYRIAYPNASDNTVRSCAYTVLKRPEVKEYIRELQKDYFDALNITAERIACELAELAFSEFDDNNNATSKLKALDLLQKQMGLQNQKMEINGEQKIVISIGEDEE